MKSIVSKLLLPLGMAAALPVSAKLVAWYPLDESPAAATTVAENVVGNSATMIGHDPDPAFNFIERGYPSASQALGTSYRISKLDGAGGALDLGTDEAVQPTDKFTYTFFFQPTSFDMFDRYLESQATNTQDQDGLRIDSGGTGDRVRVLIRDNSGVNTQATHPLVLKNDGTWYFCAFRYDSANTEGNGFRITVLEVDGTAIDEAAITAATNSQETINTGAIGYPHALQTIIGSETPNGGGANGTNTAFDELAFYDNSDSNGVLSDAQLATGANFGPSAVELITGFSTDRENVSPGNPATLSWTITQPFDSLVLDDGNGNVTDAAPLTTAGAGSTMVSPTETTTYYLKGMNGDVQNVHVLKIISGAAPEITSFTSSVPIIPSGGTADLNWVVVGADSITLDPGMIDVTGTSTTTVTVTETTTYTLSATNGFGTTTAQVSVSAVNGAVPAHRYVAGTETNTEGTWLDEVGTKNIRGIGILRSAPLATPSPNTNLTGTYQAEGGNVAGTVGPYQFPEATFEIWIRPAELTEEYQVAFETGGGQNGLGILINQDNLLFLGSTLNARTLDLEVPLNGLNLDDFFQIVVSNNSETDAVEVTIRDTFGNVVTASATADVTLGGNSGTVFFYGSGGAGGSVNNLGGRTEIPEALPAVLNSFVGEIAILNVYDRILTTEEIAAAFGSVATTTAPPSGGPNAITAISYDGVSAVTLTWNSKSGENYDAEFSADLENWFPIEDPVEATEATTTKAFNIPPNRPEFFLRIIGVPAP